MAKLIFAMMQSLDGYVSGAAGGPEMPMFGEALHRDFNEQARALAGRLYGRRMYEVMRDWAENQPDCNAVEQDFSAAWRSKPKWVVSNSLKSVGPNATLVSDDLEALVRGLKSEVEGVSTPCARTRADAQIRI